MQPAITLRSTPPAHHRFHLLDALRGVAAIIVVFWHGRRYFATPPRSHNWPLAVDFFFCLSGFVIAFSYEKRLQQGFGIRNFIVARLIRLYPMYLIGITCGFLLNVASDMHRHMLSSLVLTIRFYAQAIFFLPYLSMLQHGPAFPLNNPAWSLFFELLANIAYGIMVCKGLVKSWMLALVWFASLAILALRVHAGDDLSAMGWQSFYRSFLLGIPRTALSFASGVLIYRLYHRTHHRQVAAWIRNSLCFVACGLLVFMLLSPMSLLQQGIPALMMVALALPCLVLLGAKAHPPKFLTGMCVMLGELSYPLYLLHVVFLFEFYKLGNKVFTSRFPASQPFILPCTVAILAMASFVIAQRIDLPLRRFLLKQYRASFEEPQQQIA